MSGGEVTAALKVGFKGEEPFELDANLVVTGRSCVLGASGSGKSYAVGVLCEELCRNDLPFAMVDTEGEYSGLKEKNLRLCGLARRKDATSRGRRPTSKASRGRRRTRPP